MLGKLPKIIRVVAQPGSAFVWGARGRWFESSPPDGIYEVELLVNQGFYFKSKNYYCHKCEPVNLKLGHKWVTNQVKEQFQ